MIIPIQSVLVVDATKEVGGLKEEAVVITAFTVLWIYAHWNGNIEVICV